MSANGRLLPVVISWLDRRLFDGQRTVVKHDIHRCDMLKTVMRGRLNL